MLIIGVRGSWVAWLPARSLEALVALDRGGVPIDGEDWLALGVLDLLKLLLEWRTKRLRHGGGLRGVLLFEGEIFLSRAGKIDDLAVLVRLAAGPFRTLRRRLLCASLAHRHRACRRGGLVGAVLLALVKVHATAGSIRRSARGRGFLLRVLVLVVLRVLASAEVVLAAALRLRVEGHGVVLLLVLLAVASAGMLLEFVLLGVLVVAFLLRSFLDWPVLEVALVSAAGLPASSSSLVPLLGVRLRRVRVLILVALPVEVLPLALAAPVPWIVASCRRSRLLVLPAVRLALCRASAAGVLISIILRLALLAGRTLALLALPRRLGVAARLSGSARSLALGVRCCVRLRLRSCLRLLGPGRLLVLRRLVAFHALEVQLVQHVVDALLDVVGQVVGALLAALVRAGVPRLLRALRPARGLRVLRMLRRVERTALAAEPELRIVTLPLSFVLCLRSFHGFPSDSVCPMRYYLLSPF